MSDTAVHLVESVIPMVSVRHWICTLPWGLRALLGYDRKLCAEVVSAFAGEVSRSLKWRAKRELGLRSVDDAHTGSVFAVQRTDSALRLNVHFHGIALDGVYVRASSGLVFHELPAPTQVEVADVARRTAERIERILAKHGRSMDPELADDSPPPLVSEEPGLAACYGAAAQGVGLVGDCAGRPTLRLLVNHEPRPRAVEEDAPAAEVRGVNVHAKQTVGTQRPPHTECGASYDGERGPGPRPAEGRLGGPCGRRRRWGARGGRSSGSSSARTGGPGPCRGRVGEVQGRSGPSARAIWALRLPISPGSIFLGVGFGAHCRKDERHQDRSDHRRSGGEGDPRAAPLSRQADRVDRSRLHRG